MVLNLGSIVEGHGEVEAVPVLIRRIQAELSPGLDLRICRPWRIGRDKLIQAGELERAVELLARQLEAPRAILILIDADLDCPRDLGPNLLARARAARPDISSGVVLAKYEFEAWFLGAIESLRGRRGISQDAPPVPDPENVRDAKRLLTRRMQGTIAYHETVDQPALAASFNMGLAREHCRSFRKCWQELQRLLAEASAAPLGNDPQSG
jgi:hypothetical protein